MDAWLPVVSGLGGVVVGAVLISLFELWRKALDGQAAARLMRTETVANRLKVNNRAPSSHLRTHAWDTYAIKMVPFLEDLELHQIAETYAELSRIGLLLDIEARSGSTQRGEEQVQGWLDRARGDAQMLRNRIEQAKPWSLLPKLLWPRKPASSEEIARAYGLPEIGHDQNESPGDDAE
jgi:hypothetical protein